MRTKDTGNEPARNPVAEDNIVFLWNSLANFSLACQWLRVIGTRKTDDSQVYLEQHRFRRVTGGALDVYVLETRRFYFEVMIPGPVPANEI